MNRYCPNCGKRIPNSATFCPNCGHSLLRNSVNRFQNVPNQPAGGYSNYYQPQPYGNNYAMGYFPGHPIRRWSFKVISIIVILAMIFCYIVFHLYYQHTMPSDMKGTTISGTKMLSAPAPAKNAKNSRSHPRMVIKDYSPTEYFYDEAFFGEYDENEPDFYSTYDSNNEFNYNTVNNASDTFNRNVQNNNTTQKQNNNTKTTNNKDNNQTKQNKNSSSVGITKDRVFMKPSTSKSNASKSSSKNASDNSDNSDNSASDNSDDSSDNLSDSSNNSSDSNSDSSDNSSDSNSDSNSNSSDSSNNSSDSSSNSSDSNSNSSDSNSNSSDSNNSDSNNSDSNSDSNSGSNNGSDSDQSYHPHDSLFLNPLNSNSSGHQVNAQLSYTIEPHSIVVDMRLGKVQKEVTYNIEHIHRYDNNRVEFTVAGSGKYAKYHSFTFTRGSGNQYEIDAVNGSHVSAEHFNNGQLSITKGSK